MAGITGKNLYVAFMGEALEADYREFSISEEVGMADASSGSEAARTYLKTLEDGTATLSLLLQADGTAVTDPPQLLEKGAEGTLEWGPEGTAAGKPRRYVNAIVTTYEERMPYDEVVEITASFQFSGEVTRTTYA
ncbi:MAG: hypothetical protein JXJ17_17110 [Anaerolineae bacterium]|nr:hypothetical protein [Anaerolineae bacterium]